MKMSNEFKEESADVYVQTAFPLIKFVRNISDGHTLYTF
jgi:hypothetical protein